MGNKQKQKDRAYITASEWKEEGGGHRGRLQNAGTVYQRLPFNCCAISFQTAEDPVCTSDGTVFDIINAVPYIQKFKKHPTTGEPLELSDLIRLHFHKNTDGEYACPVLGKVFNENTHIVAIKTSGNVYCFEAINELCLKPKNLKDLLTDEAFTKKDLIQLQDPQNLGTKRSVTEFDHVKFGRTVEDEATRAAREADPMFGIKNIDQDTKRALAALSTDEAAKAFEAGGGGKKAQAERALAEAKMKKAAAEKNTLYSSNTTNNNGSAPTTNPLQRSEKFDPYSQVTFKPGTATWNTDTQNTTTKAHMADKNGGKKVPQPYSNTYITSHTTTNSATHSFTSTTMAISTKNERIKVLKLLKPTKKGYLRMHTTLGDINIELHCDMVPKTCENFMALAANGYYNDTLFHRSIKNFMIQGGDPTGTGQGGSSVFGPTFEDEINQKLKHDSRGVLAMANSGRNTNGSQFYILYKSAPHLNFKHTVFGKIVGGFETLTAMENIDVDEDDRPVVDIKITGVTVFVNPYSDMLEEEEREKQRKDVEEKRKEGERVGGVDLTGAWLGTGTGTGVGKYLKFPAPAGGVNSFKRVGHPSKCDANDNGGGSEDGAARKKIKSKPASNLSNFDAW